MTMKRNSMSIIVEPTKILKGEDKLLPHLNLPIFFMHPSTMKSLQYIKDYLILLHSESNQLLFRCWPASSIHPDSIMIPSLNIFKKNLNGAAVPEKFNLLVNSADRIVLFCDKHKLFMDSSYFKNHLQKILNHFYLKEGLILCISYCGYMCHLTVQKIISYTKNEVRNQSHVDDICENISSLDICDDTSLLEKSTESTFLCSTPIAKFSGSSNSLFTQRIKFESNKRSFCNQQKEFYKVHIETEFEVTNVKTENILPYQTGGLQCLGGLRKQINEIKNFILPFLNKEKKNNYGVILVGASGTGKSAIVQATGEEFKIPILSWNKCNYIENEKVFKFHLQELFNKAIKNFPSIIFFDDIDIYCKKYKDSSLQNRQKLVYLSSVIKNKLMMSNKVIVIGAACNISDVDSSLRETGIFEKEIFLEIPDVDGRKEILFKILNEKPHNLSDKHITELSENTHGYTGGDLKLLCNKAPLLSFERTNYINFEDCKEIMKNLTPSSIEAFKFEIPNVKWNDIGGMQKVKDRITEMVDWPLKFSEQYRKFKIEPTKGILLYGPPGCSKTMLAKALANESKLNFISIKVTQLFCKYVGESEKSVSDLFKKARSAAPCVLFFDEIECLTSIRGSISGNSNVTERIVTQLLVEMDGIDVLQGVSIIATTNRPDLIDPSFLRPGRFDHIIYVPLPDPISRKEIFKIYLKKVAIATDVDVDYLVQATEGYTGGEITEVCDQASLTASRKYLKSKGNGISVNIRTSVVTMCDFLTALESVSPNTKVELIDNYEKYNKRNT